MAQADWKNPDVICPEKAFAQGLTCLDLTEVENPATEFPIAMSMEEVELWKTQWAADLKVCRAQEVLRRHASDPGRFTPLQVQIYWMNAGAGLNAQEKLSEIRKASQRFSIPAHALIGALTQESLLSDLGISPDGGNYSCGIGQLNISEWCNGMSTLPAAERLALGWPAVTCDSSDLKSELIAPFYTLASRQLGNRPAYQINAQDFRGITLAQVSSHWTGVPASNQALRFKAITSFIQNCQNYALGIKFKAQNLRRLFDAYVPLKMQQAETYGPNDTSRLTCATPYQTKYFPLHTGWLLTLAIYNAGPSMAKLLEHYYQTSADSLPPLTPTDLIEALYWGGEYRQSSNRIHYSGHNQREYSQSWMKSCVVQRHVTRVIQHVTRPGVVLANSLEEIPCAQGISEGRRVSSGMKD